MTDFTSLGLAAPLLRALAAEGYNAPTPIQTQAIPHVLAGRDLVGLAQTGTGKTAAFALPTLHRLGLERKTAGAKSCRTLVLAPTRELAGQIADSFRAYGRFTGLRTAAVYGGASMFKQKEALARGVDILVATPGRLLDHVEQRTVRLDKVEILVLDEADHMLDMGFIHALRRIADLLPKERQSLFFSATMPPPIAELAAKFLTDPAQVAVTPVSSTAERVEQAVIHVEAMKKQDLLHSILEEPAIARALVFTRTKHGADRVVRRLLAAGFGAEAIHGDKSQGQRERALEAFKKGRARLLVATEIAARGIDVDCVTHVINFDLPNVPEQYVHRIGRTARAGQAGEAISFCAPDERPYLKDIERLIAQEIPVIEHDLSLPTPVRGEPQRRAQSKPSKPGARPPVKRDRPQGERVHAERSDRSRGERAVDDRSARGEHAERPRGPKPSSSHRGDQSGQGNRGQKPAHAPRGDAAGPTRRGDRRAELWSNEAPTETARGPARPRRA